MTRKVGTTKDLETDRVTVGEEIFLGVGLPLFEESMSSMEQSVAQRNDRW